MQNDEYEETSVDEVFFPGTLETLSEGNEIEGFVKK